MPQNYGARRRALVASAVVIGFSAVATYVIAQPQPVRPAQPTVPTVTQPTRTVSPTLIRTIRQPIGQPRIRLDITPRIPQLGPELQMPGVCAAPLDVTINVPNVRLEMRTEQPAVWYSLVDTIPPVGHTASITVDPVNLLEGDRKVGTLVAGEVKFREVVSDIPLDGTEQENRQRLEALLKDFGSITWQRLASLAPLEVKQYTLPGPGVQVMRAELDETYELDGIGRDTVKLRGWIAVTHAQPRPAKGETQITWNTAVLDTEFVGLDLRGESSLFGPVHVRLDTTRPARGQVGRIDIPELARYALIAKFKKDAPAAAQPEP